MRPHRSIVALLPLASLALLVSLSAASLAVSRCATQAAPAAPAAATATAPAAAPAAAAQEGKPEAKQETQPVEDNPFPLVVRIDKSALLPFTNSNVDEQRPVDKVVLGVRAIGGSHTQGAIRAKLIPDSTEASFDVCFLGKTATKTVGTQEPAVIYSRTFTDFTCTRRIAFDPRQGFIVVGDTVIDGDTRLVYDGFGATRQFGRRLITRVAQRRAGQSSEQARLIADRDNKREVRESFEKEVVRQVKEANQGIDLVRYVNQFLGDKTTLQLYAKSSTDCIHIGIGPEGEKYAPMTALPPSREKPAPVEIWVHASILSEPVAALIKFTTPQTTIPLLMQTKILGALSILPASAGSTIDVGLQDGWLILGLPDEHPTAKAPDASGDVARRE